MAAQNLDVTLKRYNGTEVDLLLPTTHLGQLYTDNTLQTLVGPKGLANGLASLDAAGKIPLGQLPDAVFDSLYFYDSVDYHSDLSNLAAYALNNITGRSVKGVYWVALNEITLTSQPTSTLESYDNKYYITQFASGDGNPFQTSENLETGDWFIITSVYGSGTSGDPYIVQFAVVNNVYETATTERYGIAKLSAATNTNVYNAATNAGGLTSGGTEVITEGVLYGLMGTGNGKIARGDHTHDSIYYTKTEVDDFFNGSVPTSGYDPVGWDYTASVVTSNSSNWTSAYTWTNNAAANVNTAVLGTNGSLVYGATPTSTTVGAILIDLD